ncbi:MAG: ASCH domain-containing protein [Thermofilum sp.]
MRLKHLMFSREYLGKLLSGEKRVTIRARNPNVKKGDTALVHSAGLLVGKVRIVSVASKRVRDLSEIEAKEDGFPSLEELKKALRRHYPNLRDDSFVYVVRFEWIERYDPPLSEKGFAWPYRLSPREVARLALSSGIELGEEEKEILQVLAAEGSVRRTAAKLGGMRLRPLVRGVLRRVAAELEERGFISRELSIK